MIESKSKSGVSFSVLICTYNRPALLAGSLTALVHRSEEKPDEIVVVNGGDEHADQVVLDFANSTLTHIELVRTRNVNLATSRNIGLRYCTGEIIGMTDDDAEVFPDWVSHMKRVHWEHPEAGAVGGIVLSAGNGSLIERIADKVTFPSFPSFCETRTLPGVNVSYKRKILEALGPQDENLFRGEDVDYNWRLLKLGYRIYFDPMIRVYHHHRSTIRGFLHQFYMYGRAYYLVRNKWQDMYCIYPHGLVTLKDWQRLTYFFVRLLLGPVGASLSMDHWQDKLGAFPIMFLGQFLWQYGMVYEKWLATKSGDINL